MTRTTCLVLALTALVGCTGEGAIDPDFTSGPAAQQDTEAPEPTEPTNDTNGTNGTTDPTIPEDTGTDTGTADPVVEVLAVAVVRDGTDLVVTLTSDGAGPWTLLVGDAEIVAELPGDYVFPIDPCTDFGTVVHVEAQGTATAALDFDLVGTVIMAPGPDGSNRDLDLSADVAPYVICDGAMATAKDYYGWNLTLPVEADWTITALGGPVNLSDDSFLADNDFSFFVTPGGPVPFTFDLLVDNAG